jgi:hypothetical protein
MAEQLQRKLQIELLEILPCKMGKVIEPGTMQCNFTLRSNSLPTIGKQPFGEIREGQDIPEICLKCMILAQAWQAAYSLPLPTPG